jgi:hypothetical protein
MKRYVHLAGMTLILFGACSRSSDHAGQAGSGGAAGTSGTGLCSGGSVDFRIDAPDRSGWFVIDSGHDCAPPNWLAVYRDGNEIAVGNPDLRCCTFANCSTCSVEDVACDAAWQTFPLPATVTWKGTLFPRGTCGANAKACVMDEVCAPPGQYTAHMCAGQYDDVGQQHITCVDVPFELPASGIVIGTLP